jgi:hypothetical protein
MLAERPISSKAMIPKYNRQSLELDYMAWTWLIFSIISGLLTLTVFESTMGIVVMVQGAVVYAFLLVVSLIATRLGEILSILKKEE